MSLSLKSYQSQQLPAGVELQSLIMNYDERGWLTELYRESWNPSINLIQWNAMVSHRGVMRGVNIHRFRSDYFLIVKGKVEIGLKDLRTHSPTENLSCTLILSADKQQALKIPAGVAHGFSFLEESIVTIGFTYYRQIEDEYHCHWQDPDLGIHWTLQTAILNDRDKNATGLKELMQTIKPFYYKD